MATDNKNIDLLQKFIENEKNAKRWTIMSVSLFMVLAFIILLLAFNLKSARTKISSQQAVIDSLKMQVALSKADSTVSVLEASNNSLQDIKTKYDSLQNITNSLVISLAEVKNNIPVDTGRGTAIDKVTKEKIEKLIMPANVRKIQADEQKYTVYIQYADGYKDEALKLQKWWQTDYNCPQPELISKGSFNPMVNYFYATDEAEARKVAAFVGAKTGLNIKVNNFNRLKAPKKQLEVWLGEYKARTTKEIFDKYDVSEMIQQKKQ